MCLANLWCWGWLLVSSFLALSLAAPWLLWNRLKGLDLKLKIREGIWGYGRFYLWLISPFVSISVNNQKLALRYAPAIMVANHQSWLDVFLMSAQDARNGCFLIRSWPFKKLFFFRPVMRLAGYIETESQPAGTILAQAGCELTEGSLVVCFPEGTRSVTGRLHKFHSGVFRLAMEFNVPILPMVIKHSGRIMPKGSLLFRPGKIQIELLEPIYPADFRKQAIAHGALRRFVRTVFKDRLENFTPIINDV